VTEVDLGAGTAQLGLGVDSDADAAQGDSRRGKRGPAGPRLNCQSCCPACGRHFSGDSAFDAHRRGSHQDGTRHCANPERVVNDDGESLLVAKTGDGGCFIGPNRLVGVTVWQLVKHAESDRAFPS
jgi:hypothetical protein